jgi:hypothetical protein
MYKSVRKQFLKMKEIVDTDIMPAELVAAFGSLDYEEEGGLSVHSIKYLENEVHFAFSLFMGKIEPQQDECWQLKILNYRDAKIDIDNLSNYFRFYSDHYLLKEYNNVSTDLYFKRLALNSELLFAEIYEIHHTRFRNLFPLEKYINGGNLLYRCRMESGVFARGPKYILDYYFSALEKAGKEPYYFGEYVAKKWNGKQLVPEEKEFKLALLGGTYFIGQDFEFSGWCFHRPDQTAGTIRDIPPLPDGARQVLCDTVKTPATGQTTNNE